MTQPDRQHQALCLGYPAGGTSAVSDAVGLYMAITELVRAVSVEPKSHPRAVMERFSHLAATHIPQVEGASVMLRTSIGTVRSATATGCHAHLVDTIQERMCEGPIREAAMGQQIVRIDDVVKETRWPRFAQAVLEKTPVRSMLCFQLSGRPHNWGTLSLYSYKSHGFDAHAEQDGASLAVHAAVTLQVLQANRKLRAALGSHDIIGQAKGILMERFELSAAAAFTLLARLCQQSDKPVVVVAKDLVESRGGERF